MSDQVISINSWVRDRAGVGGPGMRLNAEQLGALTQGCMLIFEHLGPKLSSRVEVIKILPYMYYGDPPANTKYEVRIIFTLPIEGGEIQKFECDAKIDLYRYPKNLDLMTELHKKGIESIVRKFQDYVAYLERKQKRFKVLFLSRSDNSAPASTAGASFIYLS